MNPFGGSGGGDFFGGGDDFFSGGRGGPMGGMDGPMGGIGRGSLMGSMRGNNPRQGGYSSISSYESARLEVQQYQERHERFGDYADGHGNEPALRGGGGRGFMFSGLSRADNPFRRQVGRNTAGGYNPSGPAQEGSGYQHVSFDSRDGDANRRRFMDEYRRTGRMNTQYATEYQEYPRGTRTTGQGGGRSGRFFDNGNPGSSRRQPSGQQVSYGDESDSEDEDARPRQSYATQRTYGGGGARHSGGNDGGRLFNYDRFGRRG